jgi:hypothetical protein
MSSCISGALDFSHKLQWAFSKQKPLLAHWCMQEALRLDSLEAVLEGCSSELPRLMCKYWELYAVLRLNFCVPFCVPGLDWQALSSNPHFL